MRIVLLACFLTAGCAALFQEHLDKHRTVDAEPRCSTSAGWWLLDGLFASANIIVALDASSAPDTPTNSNTKTATVVSGALFGLVHFISGLNGESWADECEEARRDYDRGAAAHVPERPIALSAEHDPTDDPRKTWSYWCGGDGRCVADRQRCVGVCRERTAVICVAYRKEGGDDWFACGGTHEECEEQRAKASGRDFGQCFAQHVKLQPPAGGTAGTTKIEMPIPRAEPARAPPRGFFCASSPSIVGAGLCVRDKEACKAARDAALAAVGDLAECVLVETAWCFGDRCAPSADACNAQRSRLSDAGSGAPECVETK